MFSKQKIFFGIAIICFSENPTFGQQPYSITLQDGIQVENYAYEFDVYISSNHEEFELTSYQSSLTFDTQSTTGNISFYYIEGTSELTNVPVVGIGVNKNIDDFVLTFASLPGSDIIDKNVKKIGRFAVVNSVPFLGKDLNVSWNFEGKLTTIFTGADFTDITNVDCFHSYIGTTTDNEEVEQILNYSLRQNYPNPFNPSTKIKFSIPQDSFVELKVYNSLGEEVANLFNKYCYSGIYEIEFGGESITSGLYIYSLLVNNRFIDSKKMILLR
jgi:hypothetical protein